MAESEETPDKLFKKTLEEARQAVQAVREDNEADKNKRTGRHAMRAVKDKK